MTIRKLFHLTHLDNVPGIAQRGLLCRNRIDQQALSYVDLSDPGCQARRTHRRLDDMEVDLHRYVPLFLNPRNPMLFRLLCTLRERGHSGELAILEISAEPAQWLDSLLADGIASSPASHLFHADDPEGWEALDWDAIRCRNWKDQPDPKAAKRRKMAEVMVSGSLAPRHIHKVWVQQPSALETLSRRLSPANLGHCHLDERHELFFS